MYEEEIKSKIMQALDDFNVVDLKSSGNMVYLETDEGGKYVVVIGKLD